MSFTIICNECNSKNVDVNGDLDCIAIVTCNNCGHEQYGDDFPNENNKHFYTKCLKCEKGFTHQHVMQKFCSKCSAEIWKDIDEGYYDNDAIRGLEPIPLLEKRKSPSN